MISSVVPVKSPVTRANSGQVGSAAVGWPFVRLYLMLAGRISRTGRTFAAQAASEGSVDPGGNVAKWRGAVAVCDREVAPTDAGAVGAVAVPCAGGGESIGRLLERPPVPHAARTTSTV